MEKQKLKERKINPKLHITPHTSHNSGITLVALIITIIVLLILAVVAIRAVQGDGILQYAKDAKEKYSAAQEKEQIQLALNEWQIQKNIQSGSFKNFMQERLPDANITENADGSLNVKMTGEYAVKEDGTITGIVPQDNSGQYFVIGKPGDSEVVVYYVTNTQLIAYALNSDEGRFDLGGQAAIALKSNPAALTITVGETQVTITTSDTAIFFRQENEQTGEILEGIGGYIKGDTIYLDVEDGDSISLTSDRLLKLDPDFSFEKYLPVVPDNFYNVKYELIVTSTGTSGTIQIPINYYFYENGKYMMNIDTSYYIGTYTVSNYTINLSYQSSFGSISVSETIEIKNNSILYAYINDTKTKLTRYDEEFSYNPIKGETNSLHSNAIYTSGDGCYLYTYNQRVFGQSTIVEGLEGISNSLSCSEWEGVIITDDGETIRNLNKEGYKDKTFTLVKKIDDI